MSRRSSSTSGGADKVAIVNFTKGLAAMVAELGIEDDRLHWVAEIAGVRREWDATILEPVPDTKVAWAVTEGATNAGAVYFDGAGLGQTPVRLVLEYEPEGLVEHAGDRPRCPLPTGWPWQTAWQQLGKQVTEEYQGLEVHAVVGDFEHHLPLLPTGGRRLIAFLGGTIGNLLPTSAHGSCPCWPRRWRLATRCSSAPTWRRTRRLQAAYDDAAGVTADFNRNVLRVLNRELDGDVDVDAFEHVAVWDPTRSGSRCGCARCGRRRSLWRRWISRWTSPRASRCAPR